MRLAIVLVCLLSTAAPAAPEQQILIRAGRLLDVNNGTWSSDQGILVSAGRIQAVAAFSSSRAAAPSATIVDLSDSVVLPGFIDCHAHLLGNLKDFSPISALRMSSAEAAIWGVRNLRGWLDHGFTTVRDAGEVDAAYGQFALRDGVARGFIEGPRIFAAGGLVSLTGGTETPTRSRPTSTWSVPTSPIRPKPWRPSSDAT